MDRQKSFARVLAMPENRSALLAVKTLAAHLRTGRSHKTPMPLVFHGPSGVGKSHLVAALVKEVVRQGGMQVALISAGDFHVIPTARDTSTQTEDLEQARNSDLWILEDLQHLPGRFCETVVQTLDYRTSRRLPTVFTANVSPNQLTLTRGPAGKGPPGVAVGRMISRLAAGLVIAMEPWQTPSRLLFLEELAQRRQFVVAPEVLPWLAAHLPGSGRVLEGAMNQLENLAENQKHLVDLDLVTRHFRQQADAHQPTMDRIARQVSDYFRLDPVVLRSTRRQRNILLPRQVSMYLARQLTEMSLDEIGTYFGGRDHTTVLHACRKVAQALSQDAVLSGAIRQIHSELA